MGGVLVPARIDRVAHDVPGLRKDLLNQGFLATERNPLTQVRCDPHHQAVTGPAAAPLLLVLLPALQLTHHGLQLVVPCLLVQQAEVLWESTNRIGGSGGPPLTLLGNCETRLPPEQCGLG